MLAVLNILAISYIFLLFKNKNPVSLSMLWVVIFYLIYILTPFLRNYSNTLGWITDSLVNKIAQYSLVGLGSFIFTNCFFFLKLSYLEKTNIFKQNHICFSSIKKLIFLLVALSIFFLILGIGIGGVLNIFLAGSRSVWLKGNSFFSTWAQLSFFYLSFASSVLILSADTAEKKRFSYKAFFLITILITTLAFARRTVIYPILAILFFKTSQIKNKQSLIKVILISIPIFFSLMYFMGYARTFGIKTLDMQIIKLLFETDNFIDLFLSNTDFSASYNYLAKQIEYGHVNISVLGYFKAIFAIIPRSLWPNKPEYSSVLIMKTLMPQKVSEGFSAGTGYIGESLATMGIFGVIIISCLWGIACGVLDKKYFFIQTGREKIERLLSNCSFGFTLFEYYYLYIGILLIMESHRGDFGAASLHFILEIVLLGIFFKIASLRYSYYKNYILKQIVKRKYKLLYNRSKLKWKGILS